MGSRRGNDLVSAAAAKHRRRPSARSPPLATGLQGPGHPPQRSGTHFMASPPGDNPARLPKRERGDAPTSPLPNAGPRKKLVLVTASYITWSSPHCLDPGSRLSDLSG